MEGAYLLDGLVKRGMDPRIAEAFVWNFQDESGLNPGVNEAAPTVPGSRGGFGLSQWTGPRRRALEEFAASQGKTVGDPDLQMDFLMYELQGPEANAWSKISAAGGTPEAAAAIVNYFLRPAEEHRARREAKYLGGAMPPVSGGQTGAGNALAYSPAPQGQPNALAAPQQAPRAISNMLDPAMFMNQRRGAIIPI